MSSRSRSRLRGWGTLIDVFMYTIVFGVVPQPRQRPHVILAPARTVYFITSHYVRLANKATAKLNGPLTEGEIGKASKELDRRCESGPAPRRAARRKWPFKGPCGAINCCTTSSA